MQRLIEGHKRFLAQAFPTRESEFQRLAGTQAPEWLFITCCDSRVVPHLFLDTHPGDLFVARNIGNVVPIASESVDGMAVAIEYAVEVLKVKHAILCGHSDCGALKAVVAAQAPENLPAVQGWLRHLEPAFAHRQPLNPADGESAELGSLIRGNVLAQLENLKAAPSVARALKEDRLAVHGWYYDVRTSRVEQYDEKLRRFLPLAG